MTDQIKPAIIDDMQKMKESLKMHLEMAQEMGVRELVVSRSVIASPPKADVAISRQDTGDCSANAHNDQQSEKAKRLADLRRDIGDCTRCPLHKGRTHLVYGVGNPNAQLMFVGEGPGADEDLKGEPFVGRAGQLLTKMIEAMGIQRSDVYIANVVKCRPPGNRNPEPIEIAACIPFLKKQIDIIHPKVIVCLGKFASQTLLQTEIPITKLRGEFQPYGDAQIMPTYHPAFLLRNPNMKRAVWEDLKKVMNVLGFKKTGA